MKTVRFLANILFYLARLSSILFLVTAAYAGLVLLLAKYNSAGWLPGKISGDHFEIFYPFTKTTFLLGDYTTAFIVTNLFTIGFYGIFLWLLSSVFNAFRQTKLFTRKSVRSLSLFYGLNILTPVLFGMLLIFFKAETGDVTRIIFLHLVIGVFALFMAAIFKQGLILQEEQDLTF